MTIKITTMPGAVEVKMEAEGGRHKAWKLSHLFKLKPIFRKKQKTPEERRDQLDRDMQTNWEQLPATLRRRRERMSQAVLDMFTEDDAHLQPSEADISSQKFPDNGQANQQDTVSLESRDSSSPDAVVLMVQPEIHREGSISSLDAATEENKENVEEKLLEHLDVQSSAEDTQEVAQILCNEETETVLQNVDEEAVHGDQKQCVSEQNASSDISQEDVKEHPKLEVQCSEENDNCEKGRITLSEPGLLELSDTSENTEKQLEMCDTLEESVKDSVSHLNANSDVSKQQNGEQDTNELKSDDIDSSEEHIKSMDSKSASNNPVNKDCIGTSNTEQAATQLAHIESQDSLLVSSSASSSTSSSPDNEEQNTDSGVNSPSPGSSTESHFDSYYLRNNIPPSNNGILNYPKPQTELELMHLQITKKHPPSKIQTGISKLASDTSGTEINVPMPQQNAISDASKVTNSKEITEVYDIAIPRVEFNHSSKATSYKPPQASRKEHQTCSFEHKDVPTSDDILELGKAEEDVLSYYDSIVQEEQTNGEEKNDTEDIRNDSKSYYTLFPRTTGISMEFTGFYKNDFIHSVVDDMELECHPKVVSAESDSNKCCESADKIVQMKVLPFDGKWKPKSYVMETLNKKPLAAKMATILEEKEGEIDISEKLSVREILQRFEKIGYSNGANGQQEDDRTLLEIHETLRCLEEKVRLYTSTGSQESNDDASFGKLQQKTISHLPEAVVPSKVALDAWTGHSRHHQPAPVLQPHPASPVQHQHQRSSIVTASSPQPSETPSRHDGKHSLLQFAMLYFRQSPEKFEMLKRADGSISGSLKVIENLKTSNKKNKSKSKSNKENDWTWKEQVDLVKFSSVPIEQSLLRLEPGELSDLAVECFTAVMRYMGDLPMITDSSEVKCVYTILMHCHKHEALRDEVYCQLMKQTTNNKSVKPDSCQRGWRLFSIVAAYFTCSDTLKPYLFKYLETAAYDKRRAYHGTATVCLQNLRKTFKYGGRKNVPSVEEITAISAGRNSKRQIYRLPGGTERVVNTKSTTVVQDVIEELCAIIGVTSGDMEMEEFSLYCIVEGDTFTMPLAREEYILDVTTELHKNQQVFYLIFCRSVWHFPLRLDSQLYVEVVFNQIAPDYLEGLLLVMPGEQLQQDVIYDIAKIAALLHRAADMSHVPTMKETKFLLPKPALTVRDVKPAQWVNMVQGNWREVEMLSVIQAKAQVLDILSKWPLFGSSFFAVKRVSDPKDRSDHILALNRHGVHFIDLVTHETLAHYPFSEVISTRKVKSEDGTLFLDMKCGNLMQQRITRLQTDQAHEISRLIRQYITMEQRLRNG